MLMFLLDLLSKFITAVLVFANSVIDISSSACIDDFFSLGLCVLFATSSSPV
jgi:hypothetical protein